MSLAAGFCAQKSSNAANADHSAKSMQDFLYLVADFDLCPITDELSGGSPCLDLVFKSVDELPISLDGINIGHQGLHTNKTLGNSGTKVSSWMSK